MVKVLVIADEEAPSLHVRMLRDLSPDLVLVGRRPPLGLPRVRRLSRRRPAGLRPRQPRPGDRARPSGAATAPTPSAGLPVDSPRPRGAVNADQRVVEAAGLRIAGLGGCVRYQPGTAPVHPAPVRRRARAGCSAGHARAVPSTSCSPTRHLSVSATARTGRTTASRPCTPRSHRLEPTWHLHGHIHPYGQPMPDRQVGPTTLRNVIPWKVIEIAAAGAPHRQRPAPTQAGHAVMVRDTGSPRVGRRERLPARATPPGALPARQLDAARLRTRATRPSPSARSSRRSAAVASAPSASR